MRTNHVDRGWIADAVKRRRLSLGLTSEEVALKAGCAKSYLSAIEHGHRSPGAHILRRLEQALELPEGQLLDAAMWTRTPLRVRDELAEARARAEAGRALLERLKGGGIDEAYRRGSLRELVDAIAPPEMLPPVAVPLAKRVPLINRVSAGYPREFTDLGYPARVAREEVSCPDLADPDAFACRVVGDSMEPDYREGDIVIFSPMKALRSGQDCFARLEPRHESTFKRVYFERDGAGREMIRLQPLNAKYPPRTVDREEVAGLYAAARVMREVG